MRATIPVLLAAALLASAGDVATTSLLPNRTQSLKFAVIGDNGTGNRPQFEVADQMIHARETFPFELVLMLGDNFYGSQRPQDRVQKFDRPYKSLLDAGVTFHAVLGNHDEPDMVGYPPLHMGGERYYTFARGSVRFFALDTNALDDDQVAWISDALARATEPWKICSFHHPLYSDGARHGSAVDIRVRLEPILLKYGVNAVFSGHDHFYERLTPQHGISYFVSGAGGQLRKGGIDSSPTTAAAYDQDQSFMLVEIDGAEMYFEAISRTGASIDAGVIHRQGGTS